MAEKHNEEALVEAERSLALNPSFIFAYSGMCVSNFFMGRPEKTIECADRAIRLSPRDPLLWLFYFEKAGGYSMLQNDAQAIEWNRRALAMAPHYPLIQVRLAAELALSGQEPEAREMLGLYLSNRGTLVRTLAQWKVSWEAFSHDPIYAAMWQRLGEGLRKAGMPEE
jgi:tetratricopeptide (TPR) repeat protein